MFREFTVPEKLGNGISEALNTTRSVAVASILLSSMRASQKIHGYVIQKYPLFHCLYLNLTHSFYEQILVHPEITLHIQIIFMSISL